MLRCIEGRKELEIGKRISGLNEGRNMNVMKVIHYLITMYIKAPTVTVPGIPITIPTITPFFKDGLLKSSKKFKKKPNAFSKMEKKIKTV